MREDGFDHLLTDYDRVLLQFGMHISWNVLDDSGLPVFCGCS